MGKRIVLGAVAILLVIAAAYASFYVAPEERTMGLIQRIFYFHVGSAWAGLLAFFVCFIGNLMYVWKREPKVRLAGSGRRGGGACIHDRRAHHRADLGASRLGHLVDVGRPADFHVRAVAALRIVFAAADSDRRAGAGAPCSARSSAFLLLLMCRWCSARFAGGARSILRRSSWAARGLAWIPPCGRCCSSPGWPCAFLWRF